MALQRKPCPNPQSLSVGYITKQRDLADVTKVGGPSLRLFATW